MRPFKHHKRHEDVERKDYARMTRLARMDGRHAGVFIDAADNSRYAIPKYKNKNKKRKVVYVEEDDSDSDEHVVQVKRHRRGRVNRHNEENRAPPAPPAPPTPPTPSGMTTVHSQLPGWYNSLPDPRSIYHRSM